MGFTRAHRKKLSEAHKGKRHSLKHRAQQSRAQLQRFDKMGKKVCRMCGARKHTTDWHHRRARLGQIKEEAKREESVGYKRPWLSGRHKWMRGKKNWRWKGGSKKGAYKRTDNFRHLRLVVFARDKWTCMQCGCRKLKQLVAHHIDHNCRHSYLENLVTLCRGDNNKAENKKYKKVWEKKFRAYTESIIYEVE